jgi:hypothetical protein
MTEYERFELVFTKTRVYKFGHLYVRLCPLYSAKVHVTSLQVYSVCRQWWKVCITSKREKGIHNVLML